jgi:putative transposase
MPRNLRVEFPGAIYHVMSRGDRREDIFRDDVDLQDFLKRLAEACQKTGFQVHAYCLMGNHFHLVVETHAGFLCRLDKWFGMKRLKRIWSLGTALPTIFVNGSVLNGP